jgi:hypothetical protein
VGIRPREEAALRSRGENEGEKGPIVGTSAS